MYSLNRIASARGDLRWAAQHAENVLDDFVHSCQISDVRIFDKGACYPFSADAVCDVICQTDWMDGPAFDIELVLNAMRERNVTQTDMAKVMGLPSQSAFSNITKNKRRITAEEARRAYDFLGIKREPAIQWVPIIGIANAGQWREAIHMPLGRLPVQPKSVADEAFAVEVSGDSMDQVIPEGGHIIVDPRQKELRDGKVYLIQNAEGEATVKAYFRKPARFEPLSTNPEHQGWLVSDRDFVVLGRVVKAVRDL